MQSTRDSTGSLDPGRGARRFSPRSRVRDLQPASPLAGASSSWRWGRPTPFPCGRCAKLTGLSRVAKDEPSGSASGEEGGLGFSVGVEQEEQVFSVLVRKKVSRGFLDE